MVGGCLLAGCLTLRLLSARFAWHLDVAWPDIAITVALMMAMGGIYMLLPLLIRGTQAPVSRLLWLIVTAGLVMRLLFLGSAPIMEDDHYRYLWDGAVAAEGINPFRYAPLQAAENAGLAVHALAGPAGEVLERVNYPHLRTVYPALAQAGFALAHVVAPFDLDGWRLVVLVAELIGLALLLQALARLDLSPLWAALYWWNPLIVKELANSAHMDGLLVPLLAGAIWAVTRYRHTAASVLMGLAAGVKLWPVLLLPVVLRPLLTDPKRLVVALLLLAAIGALLVWPVAQAGLPPSSGFVAYGQTWQMNDAAFSVVQGVAEWFWPADDARLAARLAVVAALFALLVVLIARPADDSHQTLRRLLILSAGLFLLSPTGFPWYAVWFVPFLVVVPVTPLLLLTALLPLYYLRFAFARHGLESVFDHYVVWLEFGPVWLWLGLIGWRRRRNA
ncbi:MAG: hypothetical protein AAF563_23390 [Pseudomonadota bacterium]